MSDYDSCPKSTLYLDNRQIKGIQTGQNGHFLKLTLKLTEASQLQTYRHNSPEKSKQKQAGNTVVVPVVKTIAENIKII